MVIANAFGPLFMYLEAPGISLSMTIDYFWLPNQNLRVYSLDQSSPWYSWLLTLLRAKTISRCTISHIPILKIHLFSSIVCFFHHCAFLCTFSFCLFVYWLWQNIEQLRNLILLHIITRYFCTLASVRLWNFFKGGSKLFRKSTYSKEIVVFCQYNELTKIGRYFGK